MVAVTNLAKLYKCVNDTKTINQAVARHINRFPERFTFQLTKDELNELMLQISSNWRSQFGTTNMAMSRSLPYVFTEQGMAMLNYEIRGIQVMRDFEKPIIKTHSLITKKGVIMYKENIKT